MYTKIHPDKICVRGNVTNGIKINTISVPSSYEYPKPSCIVRVGIFVLIARNFNNNKLN